MQNLKSTHEKPEHPLSTTSLLDYRSDFFELFEARWSNSDEAISGRIILEVRCFNSSSKQNPTLSKEELSVKIKHFFTNRSNFLLITQISEPFLKRFPNEQSDFTDHKKFTWEPNYFVNSYPS